MAALHTRDSGQAAVETALSMPLILFLMLGTLQLFMMMQGRLLAQFALERATRAASVNFGKCASMNDAAIAALIPSIHSYLSPGGSAAAKYQAAFALRRANKFNAAEDNGNDRTIVWIDRQFQNVPADPEEDFDLPYAATVGPSREPIMLESHMTFWYPLRIPFADWVMSRMMLASFALGNYTAQNPLLETQTANWQSDGWTPPAQVGAEYAARVRAGQYVFPIDVNHVARMMTPPRDFARNCW